MCNSIIDSFEDIDLSKFYHIDLTKLDDRDLYLAHMLYNMKGIVQAERDLQRTTPEVSTVNAAENKGKFPCKECDKSFATQKSLNQHKVSHDPPEHRCTMCVPPKDFKRRSAHVEHRKTQHHYCKPYLCDYADCNEAFSDSEELEAHGSREHSKCYICSQTFLSAVGLKLHLNKCGVLKEVMAEKDAKGRKKVEQYARRPSTSSADQRGDRSMPIASSPSSGTSGYSSSPDQTSNLNAYQLE